KNCGACNMGCALIANGAPSCVGGMCGVGSCNLGYADCDKMAVDGCEVNTLTSVANCGACNAACPQEPNSMPGCMGGQCTIASCSANHADCNKTVGDGCESDLNADINNCSACGMKCVEANATPSCTLGVCGIQSCNVNFADCDKMTANGCEVNLHTDKMNC